VTDKAWCRRTPLFAPPPAGDRTDRLTLPRHRAEDFYACARRGPTRRRPPYRRRPFSAEETWTKLLRYAACGRCSASAIAIEEKATGGFVGELGFADFKRDIAPPLGDRPELGWALLPASTPGYATEAVLAVLDWGDVELGRRQTVCLISRQPAVAARRGKGRLSRAAARRPTRAATIIFAR